MFFRIETAATQLVCETKKRLEKSIFVAVQPCWWVMYSAVGGPGPAAAKRGGNGSDDEGRELATLITERRENEREKKTTEDGEWKGSRRVVDSTRRGGPLCRWPR